MCVSMFVYECACVPVCMFVCDVCMCICLIVCLHLCLCVYVYACLCKSTIIPKLNTRNAYAQHMPNTRRTRKAPHARAQTTTRASRRPVVARRFPRSRERERKGLPLTTPHLCLPEILNPFLSLLQRCHGGGNELTLVFTAPRSPKEGGKELS